VRSVTIPEGVTEIGGAAFRGCTSLTSVNIPASVKTIYEAAFLNTSLTSITIPSTVTDLRGGAFSYCSSLTSVTFAAPASVTSIESNMFYDCSNLTSIIIPASVKTIGSYAFYNCAKLTSITFAAPASVTSLAAQVFTGCDSLTTITLPASVTSIHTTSGFNTFYRCYNLTAVNVESGNSAYSSYDGVLLNKSGQTIILFPPAKTTFVMPATITDIDTMLSNSKLTSVTLSSSMTMIKANAFKGCSSLTHVTIPASVGYIARDAFSGCNLNTVTVLRETPPDLATGGLPVGTRNLQNIKVPASAVDAYKEADGWKSYASRISAMSGDK
jgi:hypothetical protein